MKKRNNLTIVQKLERQILMLKNRLIEANERADRNLGYYEEKQKELGILYLVELKERG